MIALDTNVVLHYLVQDDPVQSRLARRLMEHPTAYERPCFISLATMMEIVWVLRSRYKMANTLICDALDTVLFAEGILVQNEREVFKALSIVREGSGSFEDALIAELGQWMGCRTTLTFDRKAARLPGFELI